MVESAEPTVKCCEPLQRELLEYRSDFGDDTLTSIVESWTAQRETRVVLGRIKADRGCGD